MKGIYIWGTGRRARQIVRAFFDELVECDIRGFIDNFSEERSFNGWSVFPPDVLRKQQDLNIFIAVDNRKPIVDQIARDYPYYSERILDIRFFEKLKIFARYRNTNDPEIQEILDYLEDESLTWFNYPFVNKYDNSVRVKKDENLGLFYFIYQDKRIYLSRKFHNDCMAREYVKSLYIEQDEQSPHRYLTRTYDVPDQSIVIDAGCAEGFFSIGIIERVQHIYIFEPDPMWCEALKYTFEPFKKKVTIVEKALSNFVYGKTTTIDNEIKDLNVDFVKMDIEGEELYALQGARRTIGHSPRIKCVVCTYHQEFAYDAIKLFFEHIGLKTEHSRGYMWFDERYNEMRPFVLRRGLIRAYK